MTAPDIAGVAGVLMILAAYAGATTGRLDARRAPALVLNLVGASLILLSLAYDFNLSAALMEGAWALVSLIGLVRLALSAFSRREKEGPAREAGGRMRD